MPSSFRHPVRESGVSDRHACMLTPSSVVPLEATALAAGDVDDATPDEQRLAVATTEAPSPRKNTQTGYHHSRSVPHNVFELQPTSFLCAWSCVVGLHTICAVYLMQAARVCLFLAQPYMAYWTQLTAGDRHDYFGVAGVVVGVVGALHWWQLTCILWASLHARELVLLDRAFKLPIPRRVMQHAAEQLKSQGRQYTQATTDRVHPSALQDSPISRRTRRQPARLIVRLWRFLFSRQGIFGIESDWFSIVYTNREAIEVVSQAFQARRSSELLPRPWLNNLLVVLVVANCWSTPILQHLFHRREHQRSRAHHHQGSERVVCLVISAMLSMGSSIFIPVIVFWPYYKAFLPDEFTFPPEVLYDGLWFIQLAMEGQLLFSLSTADVFSRLIPHIAIFSALASAATLIRRTGSHWKGTAPSMKSETSDAVVTSPSTVELPVRELSRGKQHIVHIVFVAWGVGLLALHLRAVTRPVEPVMGCDRVTSPWFATGYPCTLYTYNCYRQGTASPNEDSWGSIDEQSLLYLTISHCPALQIPHRLQDFPSLLGVQLHNTTLVEWRKESAISASKHTRMLALVIARTNMTGIPEGLLQPLPTALMDIEFSHTNLTALPSDLHDKWHPIASFYLEHSLLREFPETLLHLKPTELSLHGNLIEELPEAAAMHQYFYSLVLSANPLRSLPDSIGDGTFFVNFSVENTLLKTLPAWTRVSVGGTMYLYGTPYCDAMSRSDRVDGGVTLACETRDNRVDGKVPMELIDPRIPL